MTTWTERTAPTASSWLKGEIKFFKRSDNFYEGQRGRFGGSVPKKLASNFFELGTASYPGDHHLGCRTDNFFESVTR